MFVENGMATSDDTWRTLEVTNLTTTGPTCVWGGAADLHITVNGSLNGVWVGSPVRLYQPYIYGIYAEADGRSWLGRRTYSFTSTYVPVAGPLAPADSGGLQLTYYDQAGAVTTIPAQVRRVDIVVRAPTYRSAVEPDYHQLSTSAYVRNDE